MSATQHTPGPWITDWETGHVTSEQIKTAGKIVCTMPGTNAEGYRLANARLIAAAPDLLESLWDMLALATMMQAYFEPTTASLAAIKSAKANITRASGHDFTDHRCAEEMRASYPRKTMWTEATA